MYKCSKCSYKTASYTAMQKHFSKKHPSKTKKQTPKGKQKKIYVYRGPSKRRK
jgi:hypothetical protein